MNALLRWKFSFREPFAPRLERLERPPVKSAAHPLPGNVLAECEKDRSAFPL